MFLIPGCNVGSLVKTFDPLNTNIVTGVNLFAIPNQVAKPYQLQKVHVP